MRSGLLFGSLVVAFAVNGCGSSGSGGPGGAAGSGDLRCGDTALEQRLDGEATESRVTAAVAALNDDPLVDSLIVQMPLPPTIRLRSVIDVIDPAKDIDGIHPLNAGLLSLGYDGFLPATAQASVEILKRSGIVIEGKLELEKIREQAQNIE